MKLVSILLLIFSFNFIGSKPGLVISNEVVKPEITKKTTKDELRAFRQKLWEVKGIQFDVERDVRDSNEKLRSISIAVDCKDGFSGTASIDFNLNKRKVGFYRDYRPAAIVPFKIGSIR